MDPVKPWFKEFWPWFIIILMGTAMSASLITVYIAIDGSDDLVRDDYYKEGLAINEEIERDAVASRLGLSADLTIEGSTLRVVVNSTATTPEQLRFSFVHPTEDRLDQHIFLFQDNAGTYSSTIKPVQQRYYLRLDGITEGESWRLKGEYTSSSGSKLRLEAAPQQ